MQPKNKIKGKEWIYTPNFFIKKKSIDLKNF